jgi:hypothetical protein
MSHERASFITRPRTWRQVIGSDMSPGSWLILRIDYHLARCVDHALVRRGFLFPGRYDRFARIRFTCEPVSGDKRPGATLSSGTSASGERKHF